MRLIDQRDFGLDEIDRVSAFLLKLAIGLMTLGLAFAVLDRYQLLPRLPVATAPAITQGG